MPLKCPPYAGLPESMSQALRSFRTGTDSELLLGTGDVPEGQEIPLMDRINETDAVWSSLCELDVELIRSAREQNPGNPGNEEASLLPDLSFAPKPGGKRVSMPLDGLLVTREELRAAVQRLQPLAVQRLAGGPGDLTGALGSSGDVVAEPAPRICVVRGSEEVHARLGTSSAQGAAVSIGALPMRALGGAAMDALRWRVGFPV